jgi:hypothetical protein
MAGNAIEKRVVVVLFVMVLVSFSLAQNATKKMEHLFYSFKSPVGSSLARSSIKPGTAAKF